MGKSCVATKRYSGTIPRGRYHTHRMTPVSTCQAAAKVQRKRAVYPVLVYHCFMAVIRESNVHEYA